jgi:hypothetical protein
MLKTRLSLVALVAFGAATCAVDSTEVPGFTGPSEFARSIQIVATPDSIRQDGVAGSVIVVTARDPQGSGVPNVAVRLDILPTDYGTLSSATIVTGSDGKAQATYTSPPRPPINSPLGTCAASGTVLPGSCVHISATPIGASSYGDFVSQVTQIHLVPPGVIVVPGDPAAPAASFTFSPAAPKLATVVIFNASASQAIAGRAIVQYIWSWGDGETVTRTTPFEDHDYPNAGSYVVQLTVVDDAGVRGTTVRTITVQP